MSRGHGRPAARMTLFGLVLLSACGDVSDRDDEAASAPQSAPVSTSVAAPGSSADSIIQEAEMSADSSAARATIEAYYAAINSGDHLRAYQLWSDSGRASGQTAEEFIEGYAETSSVQVVVGDGIVEGAAGSRYVELPVEIRAVTRDGSEQHFAGRYVLRRSVVDGATPEQRSWHIYSAEVGRVR